MTARHRRPVTRSWRPARWLAAALAFLFAFTTITQASAGTTTAASPYDQIRADVDAAQAADQAKDAQIAADQATITQLQAQLAAAQAEEQQENPQPPPPPPPPPPPTAGGPVWGINATSTAQHTTQEQVFGPLPSPWAWRYYLQAGETLHLPTEYGLAAGEQLVISSKINPAALTVAQLVAFFRTIPAGVTVYYTNWHEPEDDIAKGTFTAAQYRAQFTAIRQAQQQVGNPNIRIAAILMGYTWERGSGRNPEDYMPPAGTADILTTDTYFDGSIGQPDSAIPTAFDAQIATAKAHGLAWGITETGVGQKVSGSVRDNALTLLARTIKSKGATLALYFDQGATSDQWWLDPAATAAWKAGQAA